jgi:hypothetical protein
MQSFAKLAVSSLVLIALSVCLQSPCVQAPLLFAQGFGPDIDPAKVGDGWWDVNGNVTNVFGAYIDNGMPYFTLNPMMYYVSTTQLINTHVRTSAGKNLLHVHHERPLDTVERSQANRWFDYLFGASDTPQKTTRISDAAVDKNCHAHAFGTLGRGTYEYWTEGAAVYTDAAGAECNPCVKEGVKAGDLLMYGKATGKEHTTVVHATMSGYDITSRLRWKAGHSGVYEQLVTGSFNTPKYDVDPFPAVGAAFDPSVWTWKTNLAGDGIDLYGGPTKSTSADTGKYVLRKKP